MGIWDSIRRGLYSVGDGITNVAHGTGDILASPFDRNLGKGVKKVGKGVGQVVSPVLAAAGSILPTRGPSRVTTTPDDTSKPPAATPGEKKPEPVTVATGGSGVLPLPTINDDDKIPPEEIERRRKARQVTAASLTEEPRKGVMETMRGKFKQKAPNMQAMAEARNWREEMYRQMAEEQARKAAKKS